MLLVFITAATSKQAAPVVSAARVIRAVEPEYSKKAREASVQGTVLLQIVVNEKGKAVDIAVLSPVGFGLDENAIDAVKKWEFEPGKKSGEPVPTWANIEVNFRLDHTPFNEKAERHRTDFNRALPALNGQDAEARLRAISTIAELSRKKYPPAMYANAVLLEDGLLLPKDPEKALSLFIQSADLDYPLGLFRVGMRYLEGRGLPADREKGLKLLQEASLLGSKEAQYFLGTIFEAGDGVARDPQRAQRHFRLCAASGGSNCQLRLAQLLLASPGFSEREFVQAIAWLQIAAGGGNPGASAALQIETRRASPSQLDQANKLRPMLLQKR